MFKLLFSKQADAQMKELKEDPSKTTILKAVEKTLHDMSIDLHHPSLHSHEYQEKSREKGEKIFECYAQNKAPGAYRIFWYYGPSKEEITITDIAPHP